jgi:hypothetical protein
MKGHSGVGPLKLRPNAAGGEEHVAYTANKSCRLTELLLYFLRLGLLGFGACVLLGRIAIGDWLTALIGVAALGVLFRWKVNEPLLVAATAVSGLIAYPIL